MAGAKKVTISSRTKRLFARLTRDKFCIGKLARNSEGQAVSPLNETATQWCAMAWIQINTSKGSPDRRNIFQEVSKLARSYGHTGIFEANDRMGYGFIEAIMAKRDHTPVEQNRV